MNEISKPNVNAVIEPAAQSTFKKSLKFIIPIVIIVISALIISFFIANEPKKKTKKNNLTPPLTVSVFDIVPQPFQVNIESYGTVSPRTQSFLVSQVNGQITKISDKLREGSFFEKGDVLLEVDDRDYVADVKISEANLADARQALAEEMALSAQAERDWKNLGNNSNPSDLVLRKPQQQAARARLSSAEAALAKTKLTLERTKISAPYDGRVFNQLVDVGQVVNANTQVAEVYATDYFEVRLPLRTTDLRFVDLPETFRNKTIQEINAPVDIFSSLTESPIPWSGRLVRTESAIDTNARQLHVVVQVDDPFNADKIERAPLKIGEYVTAKIEGKMIDDAIVIPSESIYQNTYVYVAKDNLIKRKNIEILWQDSQQSLIGSGLVAGDRLVVTTLGQVASGTRIAIEGEERPNKQRSKEQGQNKNRNDKVEPELKPEQGAAKQAVGA